jgi:hypothetical protein
MRPSASVDKRFQPYFCGTGGTAANFGLRVHNTWADGVSNTRNMILFTDRNSTQGAIGAYRDNYGNHFLGGLSFMVGSQPTGYTQNQPANTAQAESSLTEAMRITPAGYVGIGTNSPQYKLDVASGSEVNLANALVVKNVTTTTLSASTNLGLSITSLTNMAGLSFNTSNNYVILRLIDDEDEDEDEDKDDYRSFL